MRGGKLWAAALAACLAASAPGAIAGSSSGARRLAEGGCDLQQVQLRMQQVNVKAGDIVVRQHAEGDYFYIISEGRCSVTRETDLKQGGILLNELEFGDTFGEEALITDARRGATVTMLTDGTLMRLSKKDFHELLREPE